MVGAGLILIIDDDLTILDMVAEILEEEGYEVQTALNGVEALRCLEQITPTLILMDMQMPLVNGWDFAQALQERHIRIPLLVMTATQNAQRWATEIKADGYVEKPFTIDRLLTAIEEVLHMG